MPTTRSGSWLALMFASVALLLPSAVSAQRGIGAVVMPFDGPGSDAVRGQVHDALAEDPRLVVAPLDEGASDAQVLVSGSTSGRATRRTFELVASDAEGTELATQSGRIARGAAGRRAVADATRALMDAAIARLPPPPSSTRTDTETTTTEVEPADPTPTPAGPATSNPATDPPIVAILAGAVFRNRTSDVRLENGGSQIYDSGFYVELAVGLEIRPLAHDPGLARGLFIRGSYAHAVGLGTQDCGSGSCQRYDTTFFRAYGDVGFLFDLGRVVELGAGLGFGYDAYQIADNRVMPGVEYPYLRPGIRGRIRILEEMVVLDADVGFRSLFGRDRLSTAFGPSGDSFGMDAGLGVTGIFDFGLMYRADFSWASYWHSFSGGGTLQTATSGTDQGIRIGVMLGYGFR
ncbi:MAG: hypothetical protein J0L92_13565 [Deltaproteobacteria bacterium]|nr:hypothetical protein [Deltaproteobacteria bacterium]